MEPNTQCTKTNTKNGIQLIGLEHDKYAVCATTRPADAKKIQFCIRTNQYAKDAVHSFIEVAPNFSEHAKTIYFV